MTAEEAAPETPKKSSKKTVQLQQQIDELTMDVQRTRADFENYRRRAETDKTAVYQHGQQSAVKQLLPVIDTLERAVMHIPAELADNSWVRGIESMNKNLAKTLESLKLTRISADKGTPFDPHLHEAVQFDEDAVGDTEVIAEELQAGYLYDGNPLRHAMVRVTKQ